MQPLPDDWYVGPIKDKNLWAAVLRQAINDAYGANFAADKERTDAREWLRSDSVTIGSFRWICAILDMDYITLRAITVGAV